MKNISLIALLGATTALKTTIHLHEVTFDKFGQLQPEELQMMKPKKEVKEEKTEEAPEEKQPAEMPKKAEKKEQIPAELPKVAPKEKTPYVYIYKPDTGSLPVKGKFNKYTGDYHASDKSRTFPEGNPVIGVNKWLQTDKSLETKFAQTEPTVSGGTIDSESSNQEKDEKSKRQAIINIQKVLSDKVGRT